MWLSHDPAHFGIFQFAELESRLYHARDLYDAALDEFDDARRRHDAEMDVIRSSLAEYARRDNRCRACRRNGQVEA